MPMPRRTALGAARQNCAEVVLREENIGLSGIDAASYRHASDESGRCLNVALPRGDRGHPLQATELCGRHAGPAEKRASKVGGVREASHCGNLLDADFRAPEMLSCDAVLDMVRNAREGGSLVGQAAPQGAIGHLQRRSDRSHARTRMAHVAQGPIHLAGEPERGLGIRHQALARRLQRCRRERVGEARPLLQDFLRVADLGSVPVEDAGATKVFPIELAVRRGG